MLFNLYPSFIPFELKWVLLKNNYFIFLINVCPIRNKFFFFVFLWKNTEKQLIERIDKHNSIPNHIIEHFQSYITSFYGKFTKKIKSNDYLHLWMVTSMRFVILEIQHTISLSLVTWFQWKYEKLFFFSFYISIMENKVTKATSSQF